MPSIIAALKLTDAQARLAVDALHPDATRVISPVAGFLGDRRPRFRLAAVGVLIWSAATFGSGLAPTYLALVVARALTGVGEASYTVVTPSLVSDFYPADAARPRAGDLLRGDPRGLGAGVRAGRRHRRALRVALGVLRGRAAGHGAGAAAAVLARPAARRASTSGRGAGAARGAVPSLRVLAAYPSFVFNTAAQTIYTFAVGGLADLDADLLRARPAPAAQDGRPDVRRRAGAGGPGRDADRRAAGRSPGAAAPGRALPAVRRLAGRVAAVRADGRPAPNRLLSSGPRCSSP